MGEYELKTEKLEYKNDNFEWDPFKDDTIQEEEREQKFENFSSQAF